MAALYISFENEKFGTETSLEDFATVCKSPVAVCQSPFDTDYCQLLFKTVDDRLEHKEEGNLKPASESEDESVKTASSQDMESGNAQEDESEDKINDNEKEDKTIAESMIITDKGTESSTLTMKHVADLDGYTLLQKCEMLREIYKKYCISVKTTSEVTCTEREKKKKKWRKVRNDEFGFKETLFPRPVRDNEQIDIDYEKLFDKIEDECDKLEEMTEPYQEEMMLEGNSLTREEKYIRPDRDRRIMKAHKQVKSKHCCSVRNNDGRKRLFIHHRLYKMISMEIQRLSYMPSRVKEKNALRREELKNLSKSRPAFNPVPRAPVQNLRHALDNNNAPTNLEHDIVNVLISLQHRDLTPEDYDLLLRLDESVAPKTISQSKLESFKTDTVDETNAGELCAICMEPYVIGQIRKFLPCNHVFHDNCITVWLTNSSLNCPVDNLPVE